MTDEEKVARLAAILGIEGAVQYGRFRGYGERSDKRGYREARIGGLAGDGPTDDAALRRLVVTLERQADYEPTRAAYSIASIREQAKGARIREATLNPDGSWEAMADLTEPEFRPSQWSSVILQLDQMLNEADVDDVSLDALVDRLIDVRAVPNADRAENLITQSVGHGLLLIDPGAGAVRLNHANPIVEKTLLIRDRIVHRVANTLHVRGWEYVNYGFLLKGIGMDHGLTGPGLNVNDTWRSEWVDTLVREGILERPGGVVYAPKPKAKEAVAEQPAPEAAAEAPAEAAPEAAPEAPAEAAPEAAAEVPAEAATDSNDAPSESTETKAEAGE